MMRSILALCLFVSVASAFQQAFVVREAKGPDAPFLSRELGGKNHVAPHNAMREAGLPPSTEKDSKPLSKVKKTQAIVAREGSEGKSNFIKPSMQFSTQQILMPPPQRAAWSVTPEQHGAARGWSGNDISGKSHPLGY